MYERTPAIAFIPILLYLQALESKYQKHYSYPSQKKILEIQRNLYSLKRCRRTLNYQLRWLEDNNYIKRTRRIKRGSSGRIEFHSTLYTLRKKAHRLLKLVVSPILKSYPQARVQPTTPDNRTNILYKDCSPEVQQAEMTKIRLVLSSKKQGVARRRNLNIKESKRSQSSALEVGEKRLKKANRSKEGL